jgi:hypothetical protein
MDFLEFALLLDKTSLASCDHLHRLFISYSFKVLEQV